jgi:hypothetical protein
VDPITSSKAEVRSLSLSQLRDEVLRLRSIVRRESGVADEQRRPFQSPTVTAAQKAQALLARLKQTYDPPGDLRNGGPRHDNDFAEISRIRIAPTHEELICPLDPFLPHFIPNVPHHLAAGTVEKHVDIQFRLLREELK